MSADTGESIVQHLARLEEETLLAYAIPERQPTIDLTPYTCAWCGLYPEPLIHFCLQPEWMRRS